MKNDDSPEAGSFRAGAFGFGIFGTFAFLVCSGFGTYAVGSANQPNASGGGWGIAIVILGMGAAVLGTGFIASLAGAVIGAMRWSESSSIIIRYGWPIFVLPLLPMVAAANALHNVEKSAAQRTAEADYRSKVQKPITPAVQQNPGGAPHISHSALDLPDSLRALVYPNSNLDFVTDGTASFFPNAITVRVPPNATFSTVKAFYAGKGRDAAENEYMWTSQLDLPETAPLYEVFVVKIVSEPEAVRSVQIKRKS